MKGLQTWLVAVLALGITTLPGTTPHSADAQDTITLHIAAFAPRGSSWLRVFNAWNNTLRRRTNNRLQLRIYAGGSQGNQHDVMRQIRIGQLHGAAFASTGLSLVVRPLLVLQAPGVVESYSQLDRVRAAMRAEFRAQFQLNGVRFLGWGDVGAGRIFSNSPITRPRDLRSVRPWRCDSMFGEFLSVVGATGLSLGAHDVLSGLSAGQVDTVVASGTAASALGWHTRVKYVTEQPHSYLIGATFVSEAKFQSLPADLQTALTDTADRAHSILVRRIRRDDALHYAALTTRYRLTPVDTTPHRAEWQQAAREARNRLADRLYPRALMERALVAAHP